MAPEKLSIVVPMYNEEGNVLPIYKAFRSALDPIKKEYEHEIIFVDDGSTDGTLKKLKQIAAKDKRVVVVVFGRNFGQTPAMAAGIDHSSGDYVITIDGDMQNDPKDIPKLMKTLKAKDLDVVSGWRYDRKDPGLSKKIPSKLSNKIARTLTGVNLHDFGCSLKVYKKESLEEVRLYGEMHRYIPALVSKQGFKVGEEKVTHHARTRGKTKYNYRRLARGFTDLIVIKFWSTFATKPMHFFGGLGALFFSVGFVIGLYKLARRILLWAGITEWGETLDNGPLLLFGVMLVMLGVQLAMFGFLGDMVIRTYYSSPHNRIYKARQVINKKE